jgi:glucoamylase
MDWEFDYAPNGNVVLTGELGPNLPYEFTMCLAFGDTRHCAITTLFQALGVPFKDHRKRYLEQWERASTRALPLGKVSTDGGNLYRSSFSLLRAHEDNT